MTIYAWLRERLETLPIEAAYSVVAPAGSAAPYAVSQRVGGRSISFLGTELPSVKNGRYQVALWSKTPGEAETLGLALENLLISDEVLQVEAIGSPVDDYDEVTELYGSRQDFSIWSPR
ncbi:tail completion protein gp17 [Variovorax boronicumulans]